MSRSWSLSCGLDGSGLFVGGDGVGTDFSRGKFVLLLGAGSCFGASWKALGRGLDLGRWLFNSMGCFGLSNLFIGLDSRLSGSRDGRLRGGRAGRTAVGGLGDSAAGLSEEASYTTRLLAFAIGQLISRCSTGALLLLGAETTEE